MDVMARKDLISLDNITIHCYTGMAQPVPRYVVCRLKQNLSLKACKELLKNMELKKTMSVLELLTMTVESLHYDDNAAHIKHVCNRILEKQEDCNTQDDKQPRLF